MDFEQWRSASSQILWLSAPRECSIHQVSSYIVDKSLKTQQFVLYFFCSTASTEETAVTVFIRTILYQIIYCSPSNERISIVRVFLHTLVEPILKTERAPKQEQIRFKDEDSLDTMIEKILDVSTGELWDALKAVLANVQEQELSIVVDGLDEIEHQKDEFIRELLAFIAYLQERTSKVKALLTSRPQAEIKDVFGKLPCIEYDKERKGSIASYVLTLD
jgi:hypothetical protein